MKIGASILLWIGQLKKNNLLFSVLDNNPDYNQY